MDKFEPDRDKLDSELRGARAAVEMCEQNTRDLIEAWQIKEAVYRRMVRELAYRLTVGMEEMITINLCRMVGMDESLVQEVLAEHKDRNAKAAMRA